MKVPQRKKNQPRNHTRGARFIRNHKCTVCPIINVFMSVCVYNINNTAKQARCEKSVQIFFLCPVYLMVKWDFWEMLYKC